MQWNYRTNKNYSKKGTSTKRIPTKSTSTITIPTKSTSTNFYILLAFSSFTMVLLITISTYLIKQGSKRKYLLPYHDTCIKNVL